MPQNSVADGSATSASGSAIRQQCAIETVIVVAEKGRLTPVAALRDMMRDAGKHQAGDTGYGERMARGG